MIEPIEARAATTETSKLSLNLNLLFRALWLLGEEIAFATNEMLDRAQIRRIPFENGGSAFGQ